MEFYKIKYMSYFTMLACLEEFLLNCNFSGYGAWLKTNAHDGSRLDYKKDAASLAIYPSPLNCQLWRLKLNYIDSTPPFSITWDRTDKKEVLLAAMQQIKAYLGSLLIELETK